MTDAKVAHVLSVALAAALAETNVQRRRPIDMLYVTLETISKHKSVDIDVPTDETAVSHCHQAGFLASEMIGFYAVWFEEQAANLYGTEVPEKSFIIRRRIRRG